MDPTNLPIDSEQLHLFLTVVIGLCSIIVTVVGFIVKGAIQQQASLQETVEGLKTKVAVLLDRDRRKRLTDYEKESDT